MKWAFDLSGPHTHQNPGSEYQQARDVHPRLLQWSPSVYDAGPTLNQPRVNVLRLLCIDNKKVGSVKFRNWKRVDLARIAPDSDKICIANWSIRLTLDQFSTQVLFSCWVSVVDGDPAWKQYWANTSCLLGAATVCQPWLIPSAGQSRPTVRHVGPALTSVTHICWRMLTDRRCNLRQTCAAGKQKNTENWACIVPKTSVCWWWTFQTEKRLIVMISWKWWRLFLPHNVLVLNVLPLWTVYNIRHIIRPPLFFVWRFTFEIHNKARVWVTEIMVFIIEDFPSAKVALAEILGDLWY